MRQPLLQAVGYWPNVEYVFLAHPRRLIRPGWRVADRTRIVRYLRNAATLFRGFAASYCRFGCFPPDEDGYCPEMGGRDLTDGVWLWPEGLAHYVECHAVRLPDEFVATMEANGWDPPTRPELPPAVREVLTSEISGRISDMSFWRWWGFCHAGPVIW
jgi:hypothetical protein